MRTFRGLAAAFLLAVSPCTWAQADNAPTPVPLPIPIAAASAAMPAQDLDALRVVHAREINDLSTFKTAGLQREVIDPYLDSAPGQQLLRELRAADPAAPAETIYARARAAAGPGGQWGLERTLAVGRHPRRALL